MWDALDSEQEDTASILVKYGADTDCWGPGPDGCQQTLLHRAIDDNKEDIAQFLIRRYKDLYTFEYIFKRININLIIPKKNYLTLNPRVKRKIPFLNKIARVT